MMWNKFDMGDNSDVAPTVRATSTSSSQDPSAEIAKKVEQDKMLKLRQTHSNWDRKKREFQKCLSKSKTCKDTRGTSLRLVAQEVRRRAAQNPCVDVRECRRGTIALR